MLRISGTGWSAPDFDSIDWSQPQQLTPIGPVPGNPEFITADLDFEIETDMENQTVRWSIATRSATAAEGEGDESKITVTLLDKGWQILRAIDGSAIPMMAYSKRHVSASGTGQPPVSATALSTISFAGVSILVTEYSHDKATLAWTVAGEEV